MTAVAAERAAGVDRATLRRYAPLAVLLAGVVVLQAAFASSTTFPAELDSFIEEPIDRAGRWMRTHRRTNPFFTQFLTPLSNAISSVIGHVTSALLWAPWWIVIAVAAAITARVKLWRESAVIVIALLYCGLFGLWTESMETFALMSVSVLLAVVLGIPLGVWAAMRPRVEAVMRPLLDAAQTIPAFIYFLPLFTILGIGNAPAAVATVIYALPPVVRLTTLGIRQVPASATEASAMFGATRLQTLVKVQLPMALRTIITGLSQTVMMALGIVVLATLIGAGGLGSPVNESLNQRTPGRGIAAGLAIVAIAFVLDRMWRSLAQRDPLRRVSPRVVLIGIGTLIAATVVGRVIGQDHFPHVWETSAFDPIDRVVNWMRDHLRWLTRAVNDVIVSGLYVPARDFLTNTVAWPVPVFVSGWLGWYLRGWKLAAFCAGGVAVMGLIGVWDLSVDTLVQVVIATVLALALAIPIGVWAGRRPRVEAALGPVLDAMQTIPSLVYIVPVVTLFTVGVVPGIIATVIYAMVPGVRITALGIREVPEESVEAARTFGASPRQTMFGVRLPLALPTIMAAVNQVIMMVLAMVIITGLVGGGALGFEVVRSLQRSLFGPGAEVGLAIVLMAMILDRLTEACSDRLRPPTTR